MKIRAGEVLSWVLLLVLVVLVLWRVFGNSPSEWSIFVLVAGFLLLQIFNLAERMTRLEMGTKNGFYNMKKDMRLMDRKIDLIGDKLGVKV